MVAVGGGWAPGALPLWTALVVLTALGAAVVLASYLPAQGAGLRLDLGCTPCAAASALTVVAATWFVHSSPHQVSGATAALAVVGFGLLQRLTQTGATCAT